MMTRRSKIGTLARFVAQDPARALKALRHGPRYAMFEEAMNGHRWVTALVLAHKVGLLAAIADAKTVEEIAAACDIRAEATEQLLRILESEGWAQRDGDRWRQSAFARAFLSGGGGPGSAHMLDLAANTALALPDIVAALRTGDTPAALDVRNDGGPSLAFLAAVNDYLHFAARDLVSAGGLPPVRRFIVGSMGVSTSAVLLRRFTDARVTYGCLEHLVREIPRLREQYGVPAERVDGMHVHGGEPEQDAWGGPYDLVFLTRKMILAPDERVGERFAKKALENLTPGGAAVFWEIAHPDRGPTPLSRALEAVWDVCASPAAKPRTEREWRELLGDVGYADVGFVAALGGQTTFIVGRKAA